MKLKTVEFIIPFKKLKNTSSCVNRINQSNVARKKETGFGFKIAQWTFSKTKIVSRLIYFQKSCVFMKKNMWLSFRLFKPSLCQWSIHPNWFPSSIFSLVISLDISWAWNTPVRATKSNKKRVIYASLLLRKPTRKKCVLH